MKSKDWATEVFRNYKAAVQVDEKDLGKLRLNGVVFLGSSDYPLSYSIAITCTDSSFNFTLGNIFRQIRDYTFTIEEDYAEYKKNIAERVRLLKKRDSRPLSKIEKKELEGLDSEISRGDNILKRMSDPLERILLSYSDFMKK